MPKRQSSRRGGDKKRDVRIPELTAEALRTLRKDFPLKKYSGLCELCVSVVNYDPENYEERQCASTKPSVKL